MKQRLLFFLLTIAGFALGAAASALAPAGAQGVPPTSAPMTSPSQGSHHGFMAVLRSLNLSDDQKAQIKQIMTQTHQANANADPQTRKTNMQNARAQIMQVLTPDQRVQFQAALQQLRQQQGQPQPAQAQPQQQS